MYIPIPRETEDEYNSGNFNAVVSETFNYLKNILDETEFMSNSLTWFGIVNRTPIIDNIFGNSGPWVEFECNYKSYKHYWTTSCHSINEFQAVDIIIGGEKNNEHAFIVSHMNAKNLHDIIIGNLQQTLEQLKRSEEVESFYTTNLRIHIGWVFDHMIKTKKIHKNATAKEIIYKITSIENIYYRLRISMKLIRNAVFSKYRKFDYEVISELMRMPRVNRNQGIVSKDIIENCCISIDKI